jgi:5-methylcytosine-specific restriction endonuclease McrA
VESLWISCIHHEDFIAPIPSKPNGCSLLQKFGNSQESSTEPALRVAVRQKAGGFCEYCRISERFTLAEHEIDHVIALKHGGETVAENLALCCSICNRFQGSDIASIDAETRQLTRLRCKVGSGSV